MHSALVAYPLRVHHVAQWIQRYIVRAVRNEVLEIPAPMLTRCARRARLRCLLFPGLFSLVPLYLLLWYF